MRWATFQLTGEAGDRVGVVQGDQIFALEPGVALIDLLGDDGERLQRTGERALAQPADVVALADVRLRAPIPRPPAVRDFYAFEEHASRTAQHLGRSMHPDWYKMPVFYFSNPAAVVGPGDTVAIPPGSSNLDFELEAAAVIGMGGSNLHPDKAEAHIAGFTIMNDWSARDVQFREMEQNLGAVKGKDFATGLGPFLVTPDELAPYRKATAFDLTMTASVNGKEYSRGSLSDLYWSFGEFLAYASRGAKLVPGDIIGSGTCGTGCILELSLVHGTEAYPWLQPGDRVELTIEHLGTLANEIVPGPQFIPIREGL